MDWDNVPTVADPTGWELLPNNGFGSVIAAAAGSGHVARRPVLLAEHRTRVTTSIGRRVQHWSEPRTSHDQETIDESANEYLREAGLPDRPPGFDWYIRRPTGWDSDTSIVETVSGNINSSTAVTPAQTLTAARRAIANLYDIGT